jgi:Ribbon-helix-helix protein
MPEKDVGLRIRVERNLRDGFLEVCRAQDKPAAQVIREFMRGYVATHALPDRPVIRSGKNDKTTGLPKEG